MRASILLPDRRPARATVFALNLFLALLFLGGGIPRASAAAPPANSLNLSETYIEKVACAKNEENTLVCGEVASDRYTIKGKLLLNDIDINGFTAETAFSLQLGNLQVSHQLGDDPRYAPGRKSARFTSVTRNEAGKVITSQTVTLKWNAKQLSITIQGRTSDVAQPGWVSILAHTYAGAASGSVSDTLNGAVSFGSRAVNFESVPVAGKIVTKEVKGRDGGAYSTSKVTLKGNGTAATPGMEPIRVTMGTDTPITNIVVNNAGGTVTLGSGMLSGITVVVPPGAVEGETTFMFAENNSTVSPRSGTFPGEAMSLHTDGQTTFEEALQITIPFSDDGNTIPVPYYVRPDGLLEPCQVVSVDREAGTLTFETFHASLFTWLLAFFTGEGGHTTYRPDPDGFQIVNFGSVYNPGGECFGISAFAQWFFANKGGGLYPKYMQNIPVPGGGSVRGQNIIATRAHTSVARLWTTYAPSVSAQFNLTGPERFASIVNILDNTARPTILYLNGSATAGAHAVLAYDHNDTGTLAINDPNFPGERQNAQLSGTNLTYQTYQRVTVIGNGSFRTESFENIYQDAQSGFSGNGAAQVNVTSHTSGQEVTERSIILEGQIESGQVLVDELEVWLNGATKFAQAIGDDGFFEIPINLVAGENRLTFATKGHDAANNVIAAPNTQLTPFVVISTAEKAVILVTLTWDTDNTDLDLYTLDPTGDFSAYYHELTADGGELDFDDTDGFGPEHWTLTTADMVRWGEEYRVRVHYYSDHDGSTGPAIATRWNASILLYEGTERAVNYNFTGVLSNDDPDNDRELDGGLDWAEIATIVPVEATSAFSRPVVRKTATGRPQILVPIPGRAERLELKAASRRNGR